MRKILFLSLLLAITTSIFAIPPIPGKIFNRRIPDFGPSEVFNRSEVGRAINVPDSILVIMTEFSDVKFNTDVEYPDSTAHDITFFDRYMFHLSSYVHDASHGKYTIHSENYQIYENIVTLPRNMSYYGDDNEWTERIAEFSQTIIQSIDDDINFNDYDSFIIFHAGAGQEADLSGNNTDELWSTFISRKSLQAGLDPENDDFAGLLTNDGKIIKEIVILPETEWQPDNIPGESAKYGLLGVLVHEFGHQLGLPTLFDNYSSDGKSSGIGNFGVMGTGAWNAKGFVPPLPCAWSRYYLGWEDGNLEVINTSQENLTIAQPLGNSFRKKLYKIPISDKEYFLIENRQQNPDGSTLNDFPNFTFELLPPDEQDYYIDPETGEPTNIPMFNFMENSYLGCEWDFFLPGPGYGDPTGNDNETTDGSGIFIWHIDENIISAYFSPDFEINYINAYASHKGVDLEEADGVQNLDSQIDMKSFGSPFDSYRLGNNTYFGLNENPEGNISFPASESYYGGIPLEIYNISSSANEMTFSVHYFDQLKADFDGENYLPICIEDFDSDGENEIFYCSPDGKLALWDNDTPVTEGIINTIDPIAEMYSYDDLENAILFPCGSDTTSTKIISLKSNFSDISFLNFSGKKWAAPILINTQQLTDNRYFLPLNSSDDQNSDLVILSPDFTEINSIHFEGIICTNLVLFDNVVYLVTNENSIYSLIKISLTRDHDLEIIDLLGIPSEASINSAVLSDFDRDGSTDDLIYTVNDSLVYCYDSSGILNNHFPITLPFEASPLPAFADIDGNSYLDLLFGGKNSIISIDFIGNIRTSSQDIFYPDSLNSACGVIAYDFDNDNTTEILGNFSKNRFCAWENFNNNDFIISKNFPISDIAKSRTCPYIAQYQDNNYIFRASDDGYILRTKIDNTEISDFWKCEYADLQRTSAYHFEYPQNSIAQTNIFVDSETYIYPNPFNSIFNRSIFNGESRESVITLKIMLSQDNSASVNIFDIAGNIVKQETILCSAYIPNSIKVDTNKLSSGMYFALIKADGKIKKLKFAIEK